MDKHIVKSQQSQDLILYKLSEIKEDLAEIKTDMKDVQAHILYMRTLGKIARGVGSVTLRVGGSSAVLVVIAKAVQAWLS